MKINNHVIVDMDSNTYWYAIVTKGLYSVILICDLKYNVCYTFGGSNLSICKNIKTVSTQSDLYDVFMRKIGKMCKKTINPDGHYFSDRDGYIDRNEIIPNTILKEVKRLTLTIK